MYIYVHLNVWVCNFDVRYFITHYKSTCSLPKMLFFSCQRLNI
jgi:hypothetical protein